MRAYQDLHFLYMSDRALYVSGVGPLSLFIIHDLNTFLEVALLPRLPSFEELFIHTLYLLLGGYLCDAL